MDKRSSLKKKKSGKRFIIGSVILLVAVILNLWGFALQVVNYSASSDKIDSPIKIVFISDLHNCFYGGTDQSEIMEEIDKQSPDIVLFGGDVIDFKGKTENALTLMKLVNEKYPSCYSPGNHEMLRDDYDEFRENALKIGVNVLEGGSACFTVNNQTVNVFGAVDASERIPDTDKPFITQLDSAIELSKRNADEFNILLGHQPELIDSYLEGEFDLILSGHAHGGQWRIPYILDQGLYAPDQGVCPDYTNGIYTYEDSVHIISKGLAKPLRMIFVPRIFNRPELTVIEID